jgi:serine protease
MKRTIGIIMVLLMLMSVTVAWAGVDRNTQPDKTDAGLQIFEKELNVPCEEEFVADEILVRFKPGVGKDKIGKINSKHGSFVRHTSPYTGTRRIAIPEGKTVAEMVKLYQAEDVVEYTKPNYICRASSEPNDPYYSYQWHFPLINMPSAWEIQCGGDSDIVVAVLDTGVAYEDYEEPIPGPGRSTRSITYALAPDLAGTSFVAGYDFINDDDHPNDDNAHGTHVTGTIAQTTDNGYGVAGMAFGTSIMPVKVLGKNGGGTSQSLADGICHAADNGTHVISMSLGFPSGVTPEDIQDVTDAVAYAYYDKGVILVASSGNDGGNVVSLPAAYPEVIAVGAVHSGDARASYSQYGSALEVVAPGGDGTDRDSDGYIDGVLQETFRSGKPTDFGFWFYTGTSMAAPHVSGLIALLLAQDSTRTQDEIREILRTTSVDLGASGWDEEYGYGRIDAYAALQWTATSNNPPVADNQQVTTDEDTSIFITLTATDPDNDLLAYSIVSGPSHGILTGTAPSVTYTPNANYNGGDSFEFKTNDGTADSNIATVSITVNPATPTMHIASIDMSTDSRRAGRNTFVWAVATVTILDDSDNPVEGATVSSYWSDATTGSDSGLTDASGEVVLNSDEVRNAQSGTIFTFTMTDVEKTDWTYDPKTNVETSNSTTVP